MTDRLNVALEAVIGALLPSLASYLQWEYRVVDVTPGPPVLISAEPVTTVGQFACPYGPQANITLWPGPSGGYSTPAVGSLVLLAFNDGNPGKPRIAGLDPSNVPTSTKFGASPTTLVPTPWAALFARSVLKFASGLNVSNLSAQATTLVTVLESPSFPSDATTLVEAQ